MQRYAGRTVLLTGGASGIGRATVHRLVEEGATVLAGGGAIVNGADLGVDGATHA